MMEDIEIFHHIDNEALACRLEMSEKAWATRERFIFEMRMNENSFSIEEMEKSGEKWGS